MTDLAHNTFSVWRNKKKEGDLSEGKSTAEILMKPDSMLICDKQREGEWEGKTGLYFAKESLRYHDNPEKDGINYLEGFEGDADEWDK